METQNWLVFDGEKVGETMKAVQYNLDQTMGNNSPVLVWVPKSCLMNTTIGNYELTLIKRWFVLKNRWNHTKSYNFSEVPMG